MQRNKEQFITIFQKTKLRYPALNNTSIVLRFKNEWFFTMRATINISSLFQNKRVYIININIQKRKELLSQLSDSDLTGWFAHELAHVIEYESMSNFELLAFAIKYTAWPKFRFAVERRVNAYTANNGFAEELVGVWQKFLSLDIGNDKYKKYIMKNYAPHWSDIQELAESQGVTKKMYDTLLN